VEKVGRVVLVGGGFGAAPLYPIARAFKAAGNTVTVVMGARSSDLLIYEQEMQQVADRVVITTDDGSKGMKGVVTAALVQELDSTARVWSFASAAIMMKFVARPPA
jgi:ferredoxin--NADP+ reductase